MFNAYKSRQGYSRQEGETGDLHLPKDGRDPAVPIGSRKRDSIMMEGTTDFPLTQFLVPDKNSPVPISRDPLLIPSETVQNKGF